MKIYVAGKITGDLPYHYKYKFGYAASNLRKEGHKVISPVELNAALEKDLFDYEDMMTMCFAAIDVCEAVYMLMDWENSPGAKREHEYALKLGKKIMYQAAERREPNAQRNKA